MDRSFRSDIRAWLEVYLMEFDDVGLFKRLDMFYIAVDRLEIKCFARDVMPESARLVR